MFGLFNGTDNNIVDDIEIVLRPIAGMAITKKFALNDVVGNVETWQADLEQGTLSLNDVLFQNIQVIGTYAFADGTWIWAWGNKGSNLSDAIIRDSLILKKSGEKKQIPWLTERKFELEEADVEAIAAVAVEITQADAYYLAYHDGGIVVFTLYDERLQKALSTDHPTRAMSVISDMMATFILYKQQEAISEYLRQVGYQIKQIGDEKFNQIIAKHGNHILKIDFEGDFLKNLSAEMSQ